MPAPATLVVGSGVTAEQQALVKKSLDLGETFFHASLGRDLEPFTVYVEANLDELAQRYSEVESTTPDWARQFWPTTAAVAGHHRIWLFLNSGPDGWVPPDSNRIKILVHESFHLLQQQLAGENSFSAGFDEVPPVGPVWLFEGSAEYIGYAAIAATGLFPMDAVRADWVKWTKQTSNPLQSMETRHGFYPAGYPYKIGPLAVYFLLGSSSAQELVSYYEAIGRGIPWQSAFAASFGKTIDAFYADFEAYRRGLS